MLKTKNLAVFFLLIFVFAGFWSFAFGESELISPESIQADEIHYATAQAHYGEYLRSSVSGGTEYYPVRWNVLYLLDYEAVVEEIYVQYGSMVKKGDPIARISVVFDQVEVARNELSYRRAIEAFEEGVASRKQEIAALENEKKQEVDKEKQKQDAVLLKKAQVELEQYQYQQKTALEKMKTEMQKSSQQRETTEIVSEYEGEVFAVTYFQKGALIQKGAVLCQIRDPEIRLVAVESTSFRFGLPVTLEFGTSNNKQIRTGTVTASSLCFPDLDGSDYPYALVLPEGLDGTENWKNIRATVYDIELENVLLVDRKAVRLSGGRYTITKLSEDGVTQKRFINPGMMNSNIVWVVQGLDEGDAVILE